MNIIGKIVIVDDEEMVTKTLKTLLKLEGFLNVQTFNNPLEAVEYLKIEHADLIISDFIMPDLNGLEFLSKVKKIMPNTTQILLTGYADKENAIRAINELGIYKYIEKPWNNDNIVSTIKNGIERTNLKNKLDAKINELEIANKQLEEYSKGLENKVQERTQSLNEANLKLSTIIDNLADGIVVFDSNNLIKQVNGSSEKLFSAGDLIGKNFFEMIINEKNYNFTDSLFGEKAFYLRDFSVLDYENNKKTPVEINIAPINLQGEKFFVALIRDVSFQKDVERLKDDFIATLTHDLRTPLLASINALEFTLNGTLGELNQEQNDLFKTMKRSKEDMLGLVNALLEVYRYESGKSFLTKSRFCVNALAKDCAKEIEPLMFNDSMEFKFDFDCDELLINADKSEIKRVILNLLANAIKHSKQNGVIEIRTRKNDKDLELSVKDHGEGMSKDDANNLFKRFSQGTSRKRAASTGLGLYLSRQIVEAHNGKITVDCALDEGCTFSFNLKNAALESKVLL